MATGKPGIEAIVVRGCSKFGFTTHPQDQLPLVRHFAAIDPRPTDGSSRDSFLRCEGFQIRWIAYANVRLHEFLDVEAQALGKAHRILCEKMKRLNLE